MDFKMIFLNYYFKYLGITESNLNNSRLVIDCIQREKPINYCYFQHLIVSNIEGTEVFSISSNFYNEFKDYILKLRYDNYETLIKVISKFFDSKMDNYSIRKMYRLTLNNIELQRAINNEVIKLTKKILFDNLNNVNIEEKERIWNKKKEEIEQGRQYVVIHKNKLISYCKISDIDYGGGNLVVWTAPEYRGKGYGKQVVERAVKWCFDNKIIPVYWVDSKNEASIKVAKSLGFKVMAEEIVVSSKL